jgi:transposase
MRGEDAIQGAMFSSISPAQRVPQDHPLRMIWVLSDAALKDLSPLFDELYSRDGRPSIPPEKLLRALLLQVLYTIRSERQLMEQLNYNLLFRWFVGLNLDDPVWDASVFSKHRDRMLEGDVARAFFDRVLVLAKEHRLLSEEHFTVDGTLIQAWAGQKSFQRQDAKDAPKGDDDDPGNRNVTFRGERRTNDTHQSTTDPEARLYKQAKGHEAKLSYVGHVLIENRNGLVVDACVTQSTGTAEREAALQMVRGRRGTLGGDKGYDTKEFVREVRAVGLTPHVAQKESSAIDRRTPRHPGYAVSQRLRKRVEEVFGWGKTVGPLRQVKQRGQPKVGWITVFVAAVYNLVRIRNILAAPT